MSSWWTLLREVRHVDLCLGPSIVTLATDMTAGKLRDSKISTGKHPTGAPYLQMQNLNHCTLSQELLSLQVVVDTVQTFGMLRTREKSQRGHQSYSS